MYRYRVTGRHQARAVPEKPVVCQMRHRRHLPQKEDEENMKHCAALLNSFRIAGWQGVMTMKRQMRIFFSSFMTKRWNQRVAKQQKRRGRGLTLEPLTPMV